MQLAFNAISFLESNPRGLLHVVSTITFVDSKISCSVFLLNTSVSFLVSVFGSFFPVCRPFFSAGAGTWGKITSCRLRILIGQLSFLLVPNMALAKMNAHEHQTKQTYGPNEEAPVSYWPIF